MAWEVSCPGSQIECGGTCVDPKTSRAYCGATAGCGVAGGNAGSACAVGMVCGNGTCSVSCPGLQINCGGVCIDPFTSRSNCGATGACGVGGGSAGSSCAAGNVCANGSCGVSCPGLQINCGGTCVDPLTSRTNCGATTGCGAAGGSKGAACTNGNVCSNGSCQVSCPGTQIDCGGTCIDPDTSRSNCGATAGCGGMAGGTAGAACTNGSVCASGSCQVSCPGSQISCAGTCIDPLTSPSNCGATAGCGGAMGGSAGAACSAGKVCTMGSCLTSCLAPVIACSGVCVDPRFDPGHCGSCNACPAVANAVNYCLSSTCGVASCSANFADCNGAFVDGCEVSLLTNNSNCGTCGKICGAGTTCSAGSCVSTSRIVGGTISGLTGGTLILRNNGAGDLSLTANGPFMFAVPVAQGSPYAVTVLQHPTAQVCVVTNGSGVAGAADISNVATVTCAPSILTNGSFESAFTGWTLARVSGTANCGGASIVSSGTTLSTNSSVFESIANAQLVLSYSSSALPRTYTALAGNGSSIAVLYTANCPEQTRASQVFTIPAGATLLSFAVQYSSGITMTDGSQAVTVRLFDAATNALLSTLYNAGSGSPSAAPMTAVSVNVAALGGRSVRLELDVPGLNNPLYAAFDAFLLQ